MVKEGKFRLVEEYDDKTKDNKILIPETPLTSVSVFFLFLCVRAVCVLCVCCVHLLCSRVDDALCSHMYVCV